MRKTLHLATVLAALALGAPAPSAWAGSPVNAEGGIALHGYDPVSYFRGTGPQKGDPALATLHEGLTFRFASRRNKEAFDKAPRRYLPQYGGFCAYAVANGRKADIDPHAYAIRAGKLYVNYSLDIQKTFEKKALAYIRSADENWPTVSLLDDVTR